MFIIVILLYGIITAFETIALSKEKNKSKIIFYLFLNIFSMLISVLLALGIQLPSPSGPIQNIVVRIFGKSD